METEWKDTTQIKEGDNGNLPYMGVPRWMTQEDKPDSNKLIDCLNWFNNMILRDIL